MIGWHKDWREIAAAWGLRPSGGPIEVTRVYDAELLGPDVSPDDPGYPCVCGRQAVPVLVDCKVVGRHHHIRCPRQPVNGWQALWRGNHMEFCGPMKVQWK